MKKSCREVIEQNGVGADKEHSTAGVVFLGTGTQSTLDYIVVDSWTAGGRGQIQKGSTQKTIITLAMRSAETVHESLWKKKWGEVPRGSKREEMTPLSLARLS